MEIKLQNKRALVCGSSKGIGLAIAQSFAKAGANVTLLARNEEALKKASQELPNMQQDHHYIALDLSNPSEINKKISEYIKSEDIDILVNNAGGPPGGLLQEADADAFMTAFQQHLLSAHALLQAILPSMKQNQSGRVINIISTSVKQPIDGLGVSNTIRGAVANWSKTLSKELGPMGITVNNILPGATKTERLQNIFENKSLKQSISLEQVIENELKTIPLRRFAEPNEIAAAATFLASDFGSYINGINLPVDGGRTNSL